MRTDQQRNNCSRVANSQESNEQWLTEWAIAKQRDYISVVALETREQSIGFNVFAIKNFGSSGLSGWERTHGRLIPSAQLSSTPQHCTMDPHAPCPGLHDSPWIWWFSQGEQTPLVWSQRLTLQANNTGFWSVNVWSTPAMYELVKQRTVYNSHKMNFGLKQIWI